MYSLEKSKYVFIIVLNLQISLDESKDNNEDEKNLDKEEGKQRLYNGFTMVRFMNKCYSILQYKFLFYNCSFP